MSTTFRRGLGIGVGAGLVLAVALALVLAFVPTGGAQEGDSNGDSGQSSESTEPDSSAGPKERLSDEDRACLEENGAQLPDIERDENGRPVRPDPADRPEPGSEEFEQKRAEMEERHEAFRAAAEACRLEFPGREPLSDEDRACLEENGAELPDFESGENGRPAFPDPDSEDFDAMREEFEANQQAFRVAAEACGLELKGGPGGPGCHRGGFGFGRGGPGGPEDGAPAEGTSIGNAYLAA